MIVAHRLEDFTPPEGRPIIATLGNYDGLHHGHREIMRRIVARAEEVGGVATVLTFHPHPLRVIAPERAPKLMLTGDQKLALLKALGVDAVVVIPFDRDLAALEAEEFVEKVLVESVRVKEILVGPDFRFGRGRRGDVDMLRAMGDKHGFSAAAVEPVYDGDERVSASRVRHQLEHGHVEEAARLLGRPFTLLGTVVHGEGRGRHVLLPTANLAPENEFIPRRGVYVTRTTIKNQEIYGLTNIGIRPTFGDNRLTIETFLSNFAGDVYGERMELAFLARLRPEIRFETPRELMQQIWKDIESFEQWCEEKGIAVERAERPVRGPAADEVEGEDERDGAI